MKKLLSFILIMTMLLTLFVGCAQNDAGDNTGDTSENTSENSTDESSGETSENPTDDTTENPGADVDLSDLEAVMEAICTQNPTEFAAATTVLDLTDTSEDGLWRISSYTGLENADNITQAVVYEAMMSAIPFSMCLVRVAEGVEPATVADAMKAGINPRKWVCVEADDLMVVTSGDIVMLVMIGSENGNAQSFVDAFTTVVGSIDYTA